MSSTTLRKKDLSRMDIPELERSIRYAFFTSMLVFPLVGIVFYVILDTQESVSFIALGWIASWIVVVYHSVRYNEMIDSQPMDFGIAVQYDDGGKADEIMDDYMKWEIERISDEEFSKQLEKVIEENSDVLERLAGPPPKPELTEEEISSIPQRDDCMMDTSGEPCNYPCQYCMWATGELTDEEVLDDDKED